MALFNRTKKDSVLPEIDKYYEGERRDRAGLAWVLALVSVIAVTLVVIGLFLAGRWVYQALTNDSEDVAVVENTDQGTAPSFDGGSSATEGSSNEAAPSDESSPETSAPAPEESSQDTESENEGRVDAPARTDVPSTPVTGDDPLPRTGPANVVAMFAGVSTIAGGAHYALTRKKNN